MGIIQAVSVFPSGISVKFNRTLKTSTLINGNFTLYLNTATPVSTPFETIDLARDYNSVSRMLVLYYKHSVTAGATYRLTIANLKDAAGDTIATESYDFTAQSSTDPDLVDLASIDPAPVEIVDKSEQSRAFLQSEKIIAANPDFYIVETDPEEFDLYVENDYRSGRVTIKFSVEPSSEFINSTYFKGQRKLIQRAPSRWENLACIVSVDSRRPWVYVDFPAGSAATPSYTVPDLTYFETGYKYRVKISKNVGI